MLVIHPSTSVEQRLEIYRAMAIDGAVSPEVQRFAARVADNARRSGGSLAAGALAAIQNEIGYEPDPPGPDRVFSPVEVLTLRRADCEDLSILLCSVLRALGVAWRIIWLDRSSTGYPQSHVTVEVDEGNGWQYAEASIPGARLGEEPMAAAARSVALQRRLGR